MGVNSIYQSSEIRQLLRRFLFFITMIFASVSIVVSQFIVIKLLEDICCVRWSKSILKFEGLFKRSVCAVLDMII